MDWDIAFALGFLIVGLVFFRLGMHEVDLDHERRLNRADRLDERDYNRRLSERREFGYVELQPPPSPTRRRNT